MPDYGGMTTNERLVAANLFDEFDVAARNRERTKMIDLLSRVDLGSQADAIVATILANPSNYGF
jgi:hypothetical protein